MQLEKVASSSFNNCSVWCESDIWAIYSRMDQVELAGEAQWQPHRLAHYPAVIMQTLTKSVTYIRLHLKINWFTNYGNNMRQSRAKRLGPTLIKQTTVTLRSQYIQSTLCSGFSIPFHQLVAWKFKIGMFWAFYARSETERHIESLGRSPANRERVK